MHSNLTGYGARSGIGWPADFPLRHCTERIGCRTDSPPRSPPIHWEEKQPPPGGLRVMTSFEGLSGLLKNERRDVLSVALDLDPTKTEHQSPHPAYRTWLREAFQHVLETA